MKISSSRKVEIGLVSCGTLKYIIGHGDHECAHSSHKIDESDWRWCGSNYDALGNLRFKKVSKRDSHYYYSLEKRQPLERRFHGGWKQGYDSAVWDASLNFGYTSFDSYPRALVPTFFYWMDDFVK